MSNEGPATVIDLGREPHLRDIAIPGGRVTRMWLGKTNAAGVGLEIAEVVLDQTLTPTRLRAAWSARRAGQARPVIVVAASGPDQLLICGHCHHQWPRYLWRFPSKSSERFSTRLRYEPLCAH